MTRTRWTLVSRAGNSQKVIERDDHGSFAGRSWKTDANHMIRQFERLVYTIDKRYDKIASERLHTGEADDSLRHLRNKLRDC